MDSYLFWKINQLAGKWLWLDFLGIFLAKYFEYFVLFGLLVFLAVNFRKYWKMVVLALVSAGFSRLIIVNIIRWLWHRQRPFIDNNVNLLFPHTDEGSFPSGHASFYFAISAVVFFYNKKAGIAFFIASFLISIARVFAGLHWPSDILAGAILGVFSGLLFYRLSKNTL